MARNMAALKNVTRNFTQFWLYYLIIIILWNDGV